MSINSQRPAGDRVATVLVVEDDPALRMLCRVNLELENYRVLEAATVDLADELLMHEQVNLVLLDLHVGSRDGRELVPVIRSRQPDAAICLLSGTSVSDPRSTRVRTTSFGSRSTSTSSGPRSNASARARSRTDQDIVDNINLGG
jgi:response regulator RpfG family c-di-GMP phosphodiesterase